MKGKERSSCDTCAFYVYDDEYEAYMFYSNEANKSFWLSVDGGEKIEGKTGIGGVGTGNWDSYGPSEPVTRTDSQLFQILDLSFLYPIPKGDRRFTHQLFHSPEDAESLSISGNDQPEDQRSCRLAGFRRTGLFYQDVHQNDWHHTFPIQETRISGPSRRNKITRQFPS